MPISTLKISNIKPNAKQINSDYDGTTMDRAKKKPKQEKLLSKVTPTTDASSSATSLPFYPPPQWPLSILFAVESFRFSQLYSLPLEYTSKSQVFKSFIVYLLSFRLMNTQVCLFVRIDTILLFNLFVRLFGFWIDMTRLNSIRVDLSRQDALKCPLKIDTFILFGEILWEIHN